MLTSTHTRARFHGLLSLLTLLAFSLPVAAQDAPELSDEAQAEPGEVGTEAAPMEGEPMPLETTAAPEASVESAAPAPTSEVVPDADEEPDASTAEVVPTVRVNGELGFFTSSDDVGTRLTVSPLITGAIGLTDSIEIGATWGFNFQSDGPPDGTNGDSLSTFALGNPLLWIARHGQSGNTHLVLGGGFTLPVATIPDDAEDAAIASSAYTHASAIRGDWNTWLWSPDRATATINFRADSIMNDIYVAGDAAFAFLFPMVGEDDSAAAAQAAGEIGYATSDVRVVMRVQAVTVVSPPIDDPFQFSIDPYVAWNVNETVTLNGRLTVNIDSPTGFDSSRVWGLRLGANLRL